MRRLIYLLLPVLIALLAAVAWFLTQPLPLATATVDVVIPRGATVGQAARAINAAGVQLPAPVLEAYLRLASGKRVIQAGEYRLEEGVYARELLRKLVLGQRVIRSVTFPEGWTFAQIRARLDGQESLEHRTRRETPAQIMKELGQAGLDPEGRFFPDTYHYTRGDSDLDVLRQALKQMDARLRDAWQLRQEGLPLETPEQALILASIIEKETGHSEDRSLVAGVFVNRLAIGMPLQTDPTVIYGLGPEFNGPLRRSDLQRDTPYNTYLHNGLPPTPIAMPGEAALMAAVQPAQTDALYFVAKGNGRSEFSQTLDQHNQAVRKYLRGGGGQ